MSNLRALVVAFLSLVPSFAAAIVVDITSATPSSVPGGPIVVAAGDELLFNVTIQNNTADHVVSVDDFRFSITPDTNVIRSFNTSPCPGTGLNGLGPGESCTDPLLRLIFHPQLLPAFYELNLELIIDSCQLAPPGDCGLPIAFPTQQFEIQVVAVPEPSLGVALAGAGLLLLIRRKVRR